LCLPLYAKAEQLQQVERDIQKKLAAKIKSIKKNFSGDEQYFILSMYYRENHYHPIFALRSTLSLLIQIPFFIAAFSFLSNLPSLAGKSLFVLKDLSLPDNILSLNGFSINFLPVLMTVINIIAGIIYSKGLLAREKLQLFVMPFIFLVLLYNSPSALVLYWTMNNIFSLFKTILFKTKYPAKILFGLGALVLFLFVFYVLFIRYNAPERTFRIRAVVITIFLLYLAIPLLLRLLKSCIRKMRFLFTDYNHTLLFVFSCVTIWALSGFFIPANIISSDPVQFMSIPNVIPVRLLLLTSLQALGLFIFWPVYIYCLIPKKIKMLVAYLFAGLALLVLCNYFIFQSDYGILSDTLEFDLPGKVYMHKTTFLQLINIITGICIAVLVVLFPYFRKAKLLSSLIIILGCGTFVFGCTKVFSINKTLQKDLVKQEAESEAADSQLFDDYSKIFTFSKTGRNVFLLMIDGAINSYFPLVLEEKPELQDAFRGFVYYPNTASLYRRTIFGAPPIFGGYEYSSYNMSKRSDKQLKDKHNEAVLLLPLLFKEEGFDVTALDIPYVDYELTSPGDFYKPYGVKSQHILGLHSDRYIHEVLKIDKYVAPARIDLLLNRNMLMLSIIESSIYSVRDFLYQNGDYWTTEDYYLGLGLNSSPFASYTQLYYFPEMTEFTEEGDYFTMMANHMTHNHVFLQYPNYTLEETITEHGKNIFDNENSHKTYHVNAASYILLAKWFELLRENGVWDNTRIILVSDHGDRGIDNPKLNSYQDNNVIPYNPILLVKDFNQNDELKIVNDFMTNADSPLLALEGIVDNPVNPFTKNLIKASKEDGAYIFGEGYTNLNLYLDTNTCIEDNSLFFHVHDNIFDEKNWSDLKYKDFKQKFSNKY
jgi:YidC/Oxa1 family membrane protein insertase